MTMVVPCRLITRQRSHMGLTDGRTFILGSSPMPVGDPAAAEVVGAELDLDLVAGEDSDVVLPHLPGDGREHRVAPVELHPEHRARERFDDLAFDLDLLFLGRQIPFSGAAAGLRAGLVRAGNTRTAQPCAEGAYRSKGAFALVRIRGPSAVTATVCSKCAASEWSTDEIDHWSSW